MTFYVIVTSHDVIFKKFFLIRKALVNSFPLVYYSIFKAKVKVKVNFRPWALGQRSRSKAKVKVTFKRTIDKEHNGFGFMSLSIIVSEIWPIRDF